MSDGYTQLLPDCYYLGRFSASRLLLNRNASLAWFILVPDTDILDVLDLPRDHLATVMDECQIVSMFLKQTLGYDKVNFAGLGNVVPIMHLHILGRSVDDACWPQPIWGNLPTGQEYTEEGVRQLQAQLAEQHGLILDQS